MREISRRVVLKYGLATAAAFGLVNMGEGASAHHTPRHRGGKPTAAITGTTTLRSTATLTGAGIGTVLADPGYPTLYGMAA